jgi:hypothetical protein
MDKGYALTFRMQCLEVYHHTRHSDGRVYWHRSTYGESTCNLRRLGIEEMELKINKLLFFVGK